MLVREAQTRLLFPLNSIVHTSTKCEELTLYVLRRHVDVTSLNHNMLPAHYAPKRRGPKSIPDQSERYKSVAIELLCAWCVQKVLILHIFQQAISPG